MKFLISFLFLSCLVQAKVVVVSDIDDTIKVSNVLDKSSAIENSNRTDNIFYGMPELYHAIQQTTGAKLFYLSNAPKGLMSYYHRQLLTQNNFPEGTLLLRGNVLSKTHKIKSIREIVKNENPTTLILIGDNGEHDPEVYAQAKKEFPSLKIHTYIRMAYSQLSEEDQGTVLQQGQIGFVTPIEIALSLSENSFVTDEQINLLEAHFVPFAMNQQPELMTGTLAFPAWQDCRDHSVPDSLLQRQTDLGQHLLAHILLRCSVAGLDPDIR